MKAWWLLLLPLLVGGCGNPSTPSNRDQSNRASGEVFMSRHARLVWLQDHGNQQDVFALGTTLRLMGWDSQDGEGERPLLSTEGAYSKPLITPDGHHVIFTERPTLKIQTLVWGERDARTLTSGFALDTWQDPQNDRLWILAGRDSGPGGTFSTLIRFPLDAPDQIEVLLREVPFQTDSVQLSDDGSLIAALLPWPDAGLIQIPEGTITKIDKGCWPALSPGTNPVFWTFEDSHRHLRLQHLDSGDRWRIPLQSAKGIMDEEVYHPRWSNDARFMVLTGPYLHRQGGNNIRGGGKEVGIYAGRFSSDLRTIDDWSQLTQNSRADFYPDLWVGPAPNP